MSLWARTQQLQGELFAQVRSLYGDHFPIEVRHFLAPWIEEKMWAELDPENPEHEQYVNGIVESLALELESKAHSMTSEDMVLTKWTLVEAAKMFRQRYGQSPHKLFSLVNDCLKTEVKLLHQAENLQVGGLIGPHLNFVPDTTSAEILHQIEILRQKTQVTNDELGHLEQEQESFALKYHDCAKIRATIQQVENQPAGQSNPELITQLKEQQKQIEQQLQQKVTTMMSLRLKLFNNLKETVTTLSSLQSRVLDEELLRWKREQQLAGNGAKFNSNLDIIQEWCENLAEIIWFNRQQIKKTEQLTQKIPLQLPVPFDLGTLNTKITQLLSSLVTSTFIIEKQPPQVMKTNTRFASTVRLLVGGKLNVYMNPPQVKVTIISESQANGLLKNDKIGKSDMSGEILNNTGSMEYQQASRQLSVSFRNMQLRKIKRAEKKGTESVMDEKFSLLFTSQFSVGGGELHFQVWTLSLPVVVIVHGNQEPHAWATVTWDNAFAEPGRAPFSVPEKVTWAQVAEALNMKFSAATGSGLSKDSLVFLAEKAFRGACPSGGDYSTALLSWTQFCKEPLPERNFTFWEWFYAVMKLTREHLKSFWIDGLIHGFIRKRQAEEMLSVCPTGTFLLRFSDSELGGVTIAWVGENAEVFMLQPFTSKDFTIRSLADRISDLKDLVNLYPDTEKMAAFSKYCTPSENQPHNGYVKSVLVTQLPTMPMPPRPNTGIGSYPGTPHNVFQPHSPDDSMNRAPCGQEEMNVLLDGMLPECIEDLEELSCGDVNMMELVGVGNYMNGFNSADSFNK